VADAAAGDAVIIDPGEESSRFLAELNRRGWSLRAIWLTHAHIDHIMGVKAVHEATGAPIYLHRADRPLYDSLPQYGSWVGMQLERPPAVAHEKIVQAGDEHALECVAGQLLAGGENAECDWQVEGGASLGDVGGRQVAGDSSERHGEARIRERGGHALAPLTHRALRQPYRRERGQAVADVDLHVHAVGVDAEDRGGSDASEQG